MDLSQSRAKIDRAFEHLETLKIESAALSDAKPLSVRSSEINQETGWAPVYIRLEELKEPRVSAIIGDLVHNLRGALDYVVTALVGASGATLTDKHQFPISMSRDVFQRRVLPASGAPCPNGPLAGVNVGLELIRQAQPFDKYADGIPDALRTLCVFSNADKHRMLAQRYGRIETGSFIIGPSDGVTYPLEMEAGNMPDFFFKGEVEIGLVRYAVPCPHEVVVPRVEVKWRPLFMAEAFGDLQAVVLTQRGIERVARRVRDLVDSFADL